MSLAQYRASPLEIQRTDDLLRLMPAVGASALDVGARDGHFSVLLAERFDRVTALDLTLPSISHPKVECVQGDATRLAYPDASFDFVFCAEVLEHIPAELLGTVCGELQRVCKGQLLIGVPYRQDTRVGRTTCRSCGGKNPPWAHLNSFDDARLGALFAGSTLRGKSFVGQSTERTNALSCWLMDLAGNPFGTYAQEEPCIHCDRPLVAPPPRSFQRKVLTKLAFWARKPTTLFSRPRPNWIHLLLARKQGA